MIINRSYKNCHLILVKLVEMWCLYFFLLFQALNCEETTTIQTETEVKNENGTIETERITQPLAQTQHIERALNSSSQLSKSDFRPSPQLETYYEFNRVPVVPAQPEAKQFTHNFGEFPASWSESYGPTTEQSWTKVKFPTTEVPTLKQRPYQFYNEDRGSTGKSYNIPTQHNKIPTVADWNQFIANYEPKIQKTQLDYSVPNAADKPLYGAVSDIPALQKNNFGFSAPAVVDKPTYGVVGQIPAHKNHNFDFTAPVPVEKPVQKTNFEFGAVGNSPHEVQGIPWKKIAKFLTAFIPIGLLISALTPTVITVTSVNGTQSRSRAEDAGKSPHNKLIASLDYFNKLNAMGCEDRILCELLLSATTSQNAEQHIENILNTFTEDGKAVEKAEEMKRIFKAVKNQDCRPIICTNMKENT